MDGNSEQSYEFSYQNWRGRIPLVLAKVVSLLSICFGIYMCLNPIRTNDVHDGIAIIMTFTIVYANLATEKYDLKKLFIHPFVLYGYPVLTIAFALSIYGLFWM